MTPYYERGGITLYHGDCRAILPTLGTGWADCVIADPPYGETSLAWDRWPDGWPDAIRAILKPPGSLWCFGSLRMFMDRRDGFSAYRHAQEIVWEKHNGSSFHADRFKRVHELAAHFYPADVPWGDVYKSPVFTQDATKRTLRRKQRPPHTGHIEAGSYSSSDGGPRHMRSVLQVRSCHGRAQHPTEKPVGIISPLVEFSCPAGGVVAVPFAGAGSELEAAKLAGRRAVGCEVDERYCEITARRLEQGILCFTEAAP